MKNLTLAYFFSAPDVILGLYYLPFLIGKVITIKTKNQGSVNFLRSEVADHFIKLIEVRDSIYLTVSLMVQELLKIVG